MHERYFRISSFYPAAFLLAKGAELVNVDKISDTKRANFVFAEPMFCEELLHAFNYGKENDEMVMVDARKMAVATKTLKEKLYQKNGIR